MTGDWLIDFRFLTLRPVSKRSIQSDAAGQTASASKVAFGAKDEPISREPLYSKVQVMLCSRQKAWTIGSRTVFSDPATILKSMGVSGVQPASSSATVARQSRDFSITLVLPLPSSSSRLGPRRCAAL